MERIVNLALLFFTYSILGWCMEVALKYRQYHRFINRGFLTGPWLPIYGFGAGLITVTVGSLANVESSYGTTFALSFFLCGSVEYLASYIMEKRFHARWWDYSQKPMNLHGRVWIGNLVLFGLAGVAIVNVTNPLLYRFFKAIAPQVRRALVGFLTAVIAADYVVSHFVLKLVKASVERSEADNTEQISREVQLLLSDRSYFHRRFADAYPEVVYNTKRIRERMNEVRAESERLRREAERRIEQRRDQLVATLEPTAAIRGALIRQQDALIQRLYDEASADEEARALKREIDRSKARLEERRLL